MPLGVSCQSTADTATKIMTIVSNFPLDPRQFVVAGIVVILVTFKQLILRNIRLWYTRNIRQPFSSYPFRLVDSGGLQHNRCYRAPGVLVSCY